MQVSLTVNGKPADKTTANVGSRIHSDTTVITVQNISKSLVGSDLFKFSRYGLNKSSISVSSDKDCAVIVAIWNKLERRAGLIELLRSEDWVLKNDVQVSWTYNGRFYGKTKSVLSKKLEAGKTLSLTRPENYLPITIFVVEGKLISALYNLYLSKFTL